MKNLTVFMIDDDSDDREIFGLALKSVDKTVKFVSTDDCKSALRQLKTQEVTPDCIFLDINMPGMNGVACLGELKKTASLKDIPVFMYSTHTDEQTCKELLDKGARECIRKQTELQQLQKMISEIIRNKLN